MQQESIELHPLILRGLSWFSSSSSSYNETSSSSSSANESDDWHISNWFHNNTFDYEEFNEDVSDATSSLEKSLHPAADVDINGVLTSTAFNAVVFIVLMITYEILRRYFPNVYASRQSRSALHKKELPDLYQRNAPLEWISPVFGISWKQVKQTAGLDAYFLLRYIRMCFRITSVSSFWGMLILFPCFAMGQNGAQGWYHFSMANIQQRSTLGIWTPTLFMYFFTMFVLFVMKQEFKHYVELRLDFLGKGDTIIDTEHQHHYSLKVEKIPSELRSETALFDYFQQLFPNRVHSATVIINLPELEILNNKKLRAAKRLEKSIARYKANKKRPTHVVGRKRIEILGIEFGIIENLLNFFSWNKTLKQVDFDDFDNQMIQKGDLVDSIDYYTKQLMDMNKEMFVMQKQKRDIAEYGNKSLKANSWFERVEEYAEHFIYDVEQSDSDEDESSISNASLWSGSINHALDAERGNNLLFTPPETVHQNVDMTQEDMENSLRIDSERAIGSGRISNIDTLRGSDNHAGFVDTGRGALSPINSPVSYGSLDNVGDKQDKPSPEVVLKTSRRRRRLFRKLRRKRKNAQEESSSNLSKKEPLLEDALTEHATSNTRGDQSTISSLRRRRNGENKRNSLDYYTQYQSQATMCIGDEKTARKISKFAGRLGLDFGAYAIKVLHRFIYRSIDSEEKKNVMSKTGFVTFTDLATVTSIASAPLTHKPSTLETSVAPEARDIIWANAHYSLENTKRRQGIANNLLAIGALLWSIPLALIQGLSSAENVANLPGMDWILEYDNGNLALLLNAYLPVVALLGLILILPIIFEWVARSYEKRKTTSDVQRSLLGRYFYYQLANIYISVTAGSLWKSAADIIARPSAAFEILGNSLPTVVGYFISLIITKILAGLPMVILRIGALFRYLILRLVTREAYLTQRELDQVYRNLPCYYGWEYPTQLLVIVICFTYACISPIILPIGAIYFLGALMVYKKQLLYVYTPSYETGGSLFPLVCDRTIVGLICGQCTFMGYSLIRGGYYQPLAIVPLIFFSLWTMTYFHENYAQPSDRLTLERAMELDKKVEIVENATTRQKRKEMNCPIPKDTFSKDHYKQPVLTEKHGYPLFYRMGKEDELTLKARERLGVGARCDLWMGYEINQGSSGDLSEKDEKMIV